MYWSPSFSVEWIVFSLNEVPVQLDSWFRRRAILVFSSLVIQFNSVHHLIILPSESNVFRSMKSLNKQALHIHWARHNSSRLLNQHPRKVGYRRDCRVARLRLDVDKRCLTQFINWVRLDYSASLKPGFRLKRLHLLGISHVHEQNDTKVSKDLESKHSKVKKKKCNGQLLL